MYILNFDKQVKKFIEKQDKPTKQRFKKAFLDLAKNPYPNDDLKKKKLTNTNKFRLRIGKYRFIYEVFEDRLLIFIEKADSRGDIYK